MRRAAGRGKSPWRRSSSLPLSAPHLPAIGVVPTFVALPTTFKSEKAVCRIGLPTPGSTMPKCGLTNTCGMRPLILQAHPGVTTMSRNTTTGIEVKGKAMHKNQGVAEMAIDVLARQAGERANRTGEPFEEAFKSVLETDAGRQLGELRDGPHRNERAHQWQEDLMQQRAQERKREQAEEKSRAQQVAAWERFMQEELQELELRKGGQLARLLGQALPGEPPAALERLALEDQRQAEEGLVALMSGGKVTYKHLEELSEKDRPARIAANRLRTTWLKERQDRWLGRGEVPS